MVGFASLLLAATVGALATDSLVEKLQQASVAVDRSFKAIQERTGVDTALGLSYRLTDDMHALRAPTPEGYAAADWQDMLSETVRVDLETSAQASGGSWPELSNAPGLHEAFVRSTSDGTLQPVAVYVPDAIAKTGAPLVVALHGRAQTETELLGAPYLRRMADETGTIVVAPYGRGIYDFAEPAATDIYDLVAAVRKAMPVDRRRTYLFGYSMGGFSVFSVGPRGGRLWNAVMCVSGAILNSETHLVRYAWSDTPLYIVTGANDADVPAKYGEQTAAFLGSAGLLVSFYEEPSGSHPLRTMLPSLERAWLDMHAGTVRPKSVPSGGAPLLTSPPRPMQPT